MAKAEKTQKLHLVFEYERDSKNKKRFTEMEAITDTRKQPQPVPKDNAVVEKLYMSKKALKKLGDPDMLYITVSTVPNEES